MITLLFWAAISARSSLAVLLCHCLIVITVCALSKQINAIELQALYFTCYLRLLVDLSINANHLSCRPYRCVIIAANATKNNDNQTSDCLLADITIEEELI